MTILTGYSPGMIPTLPPPRTRRPRHDTAVKLQAIVAAGAKLFLRDGFVGSSVDAIALEAKVSKRTVYNHYESKEKLFAAVIAQLCAQVFPVSTIDLDNPDVETTLASLGETFLANVLARKQIRLLRAVITEARVYPEVGRIMFEGPLSQSRGLLSGFFAKLASKGLLNVPSPDLAASLYLGMLKGDVQLKLLLNVGQQPSPAEIATMSRLAARIFLHGTTRTVQTVQAVSKKHRQ